MAKVYLAGPYSERLTLARYAFELLQDGHAITSRWLLGTHPYGSDAKEATNDLNDVAACDVLVLFSDGSSPGGRHVEYGYAVAKGRDLYVVGEERGNLFYTLANAQFRTWEEARQCLFLEKWEDK